jgi:hypothetical protein
MTAAAKVVRYDVFDIFLLREIPGEKLRFANLSCRELPSLSKTAQLKEIPVMGHFRLGPTTGGEGTRAQCLLDSGCEVHS